MSNLSAILRRSTPTVLRICGIRQAGGRLPRAISTSAAAYSEKGPAPGTGGPASLPSPSSSDRDIELFLKVVGGAALSGSALGLWYLASPSTFLSTEPCAVTDAQEEKRGRYIFGDEYRKRVFFNYEKRIRTRSPPEKVFEYFASYRSPEGEVFMTPADLMRAVVPVFPPSDSNLVREGSLPGERRPGELYCSPSSFFMLFDTNNDGLISFSEYIFFVTLISIPESSFSVAFKMFDVDNNGGIDREEFKKVMALMRSYNRQGASHNDGRRAVLKVGKPVENGGLVEYFFGKDGTGYLQHEKFVEFLRELHDEIVRLEFNHYDYKQKGTISAKDFALSMVASVDINQMGKFLDRVDEFENDLHLKDMRMSLEEFKAFAELRGKLKPLTMAIFSYGKINGLLTRKDFQRAASQVCGVSLTDNVVDVIFHVFDLNRDGSLSADEFLSALESRQREIHQPAPVGLKGFLSCWFNCASSCSFSEVTFP